MVSSIAFAAWRRPLRLLRSGLTCSGNSMDFCRQELEITSPTATGLRSVTRSPDVARFGPAGRPPSMSSNDAVPEEEYGVCRFGLAMDTATTENIARRLPYPEQRPVAFML